jgi:hypothetical protein
MAKGQMRSGKEKKKPKSEHNKDKRKGGLPPHLLIQQQGSSHTPVSPFSKKS